MSRFRFDLANSGVERKRRFVCGIRERRATRARAPGFGIAKGLDRAKLGLPYFAAVAQLTRRAGARAARKREGNGDVELGSRLKKQRQARGWTLKQLAESSGVAIGYLSELERAQSNVTLSVLKRICDALDIPVGALLQPENGPAHRNSVSVLRQGQRKKVTLPGIGIANELLSPDLQRKMEIIWVEAEPGANSGGHPHQHDGEECGVIFQGAMEFVVGEESWTLLPGDSIYLDSHLPHSWRSAGEDRLKAIWIITPPTF